MNNDLVGVIGWGAYIPSLRMNVRDLGIWKESRINDKILSMEDIDRKCSAIGVNTFSLPSVPEDTTTMAIESCNAAIERFRIKRDEIGALYLGSESKGDYKIYPTSIIVSNLLGLNRQIRIKNIEATCGGGIIALEDAIDTVALGKSSMGVAIGSDLAIYEHGNAEITQGAGAVTMIVGSGPSVIAECIASSSVVAQSEEFFVRNGQCYPYLNSKSAKRNYFALCEEVINDVLAKYNRKICEFNHIVFHAPYENIVLQLCADRIGLSDNEIVRKVRPYLISHKTGNMYTASVLYGLIKALESAQKNDEILVCSYGSGSHAKSMIIKVRKDHWKRRVHRQGEFINNNRTMSLDDYNNWRHDYYESRQQGGRLINYKCKIDPFGDQKKRFYECTRCGKVQGDFRDKRCSEDSCLGEIKEILLSNEGRITEIRKIEAYEKIIIGDQYVPIDIENNNKELIGRKAKLTIRITEILGANGCVCYYPVYILNE